MEQKDLQTSGPETELTETPLIEEIPHSEAVSAFDTAVSDDLGEETLISARFSENEIAEAEAQVLPESPEPSEIFASDASENISSDNISEVPAPDMLQLEWQETEWPKTVETSETPQTDVTEEAVAAAAGANLSQSDEPSARERLLGSVLEEKPKVSDFMRPAGLFEGYEVSNVKEVPFFLRVFAASALAHLVIFAAALQLPAVVQTSCESTEFTQQLCDTIYIASIVGQSSIVDEPYDPTQMPDAVGMGGDVTFVSTSDFAYPDGYWELRDQLEGRLPQDANMTIDPTTGTVMSSSGMSASGGFNPSISDINGANSGTLDLSRAAVTPNKNAGSLKGSVDDLQMGGSESTTPTTPKTTTPGSKTGTGKRPQLGSTGGVPEGKTGQGNSLTEQLNNKPGATPNGKPGPYDYNKRPLEDFRNSLVDWRDVQGNNLYQPFQYSIEATIDKDGKFAFAPGFEPQFQGDPKMGEMVKKAFGAFSDSGMLRLLKDLTGQKVKINFAQDGNQFNVSLESPQPSDSKAKSLSSVINIAIDIGRRINSDPDDKDTLALLNMAEVSSSGSTLIMKIPVKNDFVEAFYQKYKKDMEEKKNTQQGLGANTNPATANK